MFSKVVFKLKMVILVSLLLFTQNLFALQNWGKDTAYKTGDEVVYEGKIWRAKWWNYNEAPGLFIDHVWAEVKDVYNYTDKLTPSRKPPGKLKPEEVPQFILLGFDDNFDPDAMEWVLDLLRSKKNSDDEAIKATFFQPVSSLFNERTISVWLKALEDGHETANHSTTHPDGTNFTVEEWYKELDGLNQRLKEAVPNGIGIPESEITGFRAPSLSYNSNLFEALKEQYMLYDSSIEEGWGPTENGKNYLWPYTLDKGSPGHQHFVDAGYKPAIKKAPGLWEIPLYTLVTPKDKECPDYNIEPGLRTRCAPKTPWFTVQGHKISGLDWSVLYQYELTAQEYEGLLKYNLDKRLAGNKAPFVFCLHSNYYGEADRQEALKNFIEYALTKEDVRFVTFKQLIEWLNHPEPLEKK